MKTKPIELSVTILSADGSSAEFAQQDAARAEKVLRLLSSTQLFAEPQLLLASSRSLSAFRSQTMDMILVRTAASLPSVLPLKSPAGPLEISEVENRVNLFEMTDDAPSGESDERNFRVTLQTLGGWSIALDVRAPARGTAYDRRHVFANILQVPVIPFRLRAGGIGFINPNNITRATGYPVPDALPESALPLVLIRSTPPVAGSAATRHTLRKD